jgi:hypothetical protein
MYLPVWVVKNVTRLSLVLSHAKWVSSLYKYSIICYNFLIIIYIMYLQICWINDYTKNFEFLISNPVIPTIRQSEHSSALITSDYRGCSLLPKIYFSVLFSNFLNLYSSLGWQIKLHFLSLSLSLWFYSPLDLGRFLFLNPIHSP